MKVGLKGNTLVVDEVSVAMYDPLTNEMMFDSSLVIEGVIKEINYKVQKELYEVTRLVKEEFDESKWKLFRIKRGLYSF